MHRMVSVYVFLKSSDLTLRYSLFPLRISHRSIFSAYHTLDRLWPAPKYSPANSLHNLSLSLLSLGDRHHHPTPESPTWTYTKSILCLVFSNYQFNIIRHLHSLDPIHHGPTDSFQRRECGRWNLGQTIDTGSITHAGTLVSLSLNPDRFSRVAPLLPRLEFVEDVVPGNPTVHIGSIVRCILSCTFLILFLACLCILICHIYFPLVLGKTIAQPTMRMRKAARVILVGAPGVGKGTQSERLLSRFPQLVHLSSGDLLRHNVKTRTPLG